MILQRHRWVLAAFLWISVIFFSSTALAGRWSEQAFGFVTAACLKYAGLHLLSHRPTHFVAEKSVHVCLFLVLAAVLSKALPPKYRQFGVILLIGLAIGSASEFLQRFFPGRDPALGDVCINLAGTAIGAAIGLVFLKTRSPAEPSIAPL